MAYIGQQPSELSTTYPTVDTFTGDGANTTFALSKTVTAGSASLEVFVSNVQQQPTVSYSVYEDELTFTAAPDSGEPIYVIYRDAPSAPYYTIPDLAVTSSKLAANAVVTSKIAESAVTTARLAEYAVTSDKLADSNVITAKLNDGAVTTSKIADGNVTTSKIADGNVTTLKIEDSAVTASKIADGNVTAVKLNITSDVSFNGANLNYSGLGETVVTNTSNVVLLNFANSVVFTCTLDGDTTLTPNNVPSGGCVMLLKLTNGGDYTVSFSGNPNFAANTAPTLTAGGLDYLYFVCTTDSSYAVIPYADLQQYQ